MNIRAFRTDEDGEIEINVNKKSDVKINVKIKKIRLSK